MRGGLFVAQRPHQPLPLHEGQEQLLAKLGKFKTSKAACIYINRVSDVDEAVLKKLITIGVKAVKKLYS